MNRALASRYQPVLVALHWLVALMIIGLLCLGFFVLAEMPNTNSRKLDILVWHMSGSMFVLVRWASRPRWRWPISGPSPMRPICR